MSANSPVSLSLVGNGGRGFAGVRVRLQRVDPGRLVVVEEVQLAVVVLGEGDDLGRPLGDLACDVTLSPSDRVAQYFRDIQSPQT